MNTITPAQRIVIQALATGATLTQAAELASVSRPTIYNWLDQPGFQKGLAMAEHEHAISVRDRLLSLSTQALDALEAILKNPKSSPSVMLRAALAILNRKNWSLPANIEQCPPALEVDPAEPAPNAQETAHEPIDPDPTQTPRNALCPCGSGQKFKRCCGKDAPPVLFQKAS